KLTWVHWVLYNLPPQTQGLAEGIRDLPAGAAEGLNDWKRTGFGGPGPPGGRDRHFFKLYALDALRDMQGPPGKPQLEMAMKSHVLQQATLMGTYQKGGK